MIIDTGNKAFWLAILIAVIGINAFCQILLGAIGTHKEDHYTFSDALAGIIIGFICLMWWIAV